MFMEGIVENLLIIIFVHSLHYRYLYTPQKQKYQQRNNNTT